MHYKRISSPTHTHARKTKQTFPYIKNVTQVIKNTPPLEPITFKRQLRGFSPIIFVQFLSGI